MGNMKLLDCTLSDGGQVNDWRFGATTIRSVISGLMSSHVDLIEVGVLRDRKCGSSRTVFSSIESVRKRYNPRDGFQYVITIDMQDAPFLFILPYCNNSAINMLRVSFGREEIETSMKFCQDATDKGYRLMLYPKHTIQYSLEEYRTLISRFNVFNPTTVYLDNQSGAMLLEDAQAYMNIANEELSQEISIGFHTANNGMSSNDVISYLMHMLPTREVVLDSSMCGMGKCGGNLQTELIAEYLNCNFNTNYDVDRIRELSEKNITPFCMQSSWGFTLQHAVAAQLKYAPEYVDFFTTTFNATVRECKEISEWIAREDRWSFTEEKAKKCWNVCFKAKMQMAVVILTCNRFQSIQHWLFSAATAFRRCGVDIIIYDSSDNDRTEAVVKNYLIDGFDNVKYVRYTGEFDGFSLDHKVISAYREFADDYEYIWLCRDGIIITISECYKMLQKLTKYKFDCIVVDALFRNGNHKRLTIYKSASRFFKNEAVRMVTLGTVILSSRVAKELINTYPIDDSNYSLWQMVVPFHYCIDHKLKIAGYIGNVFCYNAAGTLNSFWNSAGKAMKQWVYYWMHIINALPVEYAEHKDQILKIDMYDFHPFYISSLLRMRANGGLNFSLIYQYKSDIPHVSNTPIWKFYMVALTPKYLARWLINRPSSRFVRMLASLYKLIFS